MENIEVHNIEMKAAGTIATAASVNIIQAGLDEITKLWGYPSAGSALAVKGEVCRASLINNWITWLKNYSSRMGATAITNSIANVQVGELMKYSKIQEVYSATQSLKNYCNRAECNKSECHKSECNRSECNYSYESQSGESSNQECNNTEW